MKLLNAQEMSWLDAQTIVREPVSSIDLMERAAMALFNQLCSDIGPGHNYVVYCGKGNNGGDGLALSRIMLNHARKVTTVIPENTDKVTPEFEINLKRLESTHNHNIIKGIQSDYKVDFNAIAIDALLGNGFVPPIAPNLQKWINAINRHRTVVSIDINSGLPSQVSTSEPIDLSHIVHSTFTYCIGSPKMTLLFPETGKVCKEIRVLPIGHSRVASDEINTRFHYLTDSEAMSLLPGRSRFSYKNTFGHVAVVAGSKGKTGAALLCCKASLETGAGLVTLLSCDYCADKVQAAFPEAMCVFLDGNDFIKSVPEDCSAYKVLAIGPGLGTNPETSKVVLEIIRKFKGTMVVDADALNMISQDKNFYWPANAIITPHPGEFDRLTQQHTHAYDRFVSQMEYSIKHNIIVVLKSAYTSISLPDGRVYFNLTGTAAMAKAGSGDVLTGMIAAWLSQGLSPENAALLGVYLHGKSGELAEKLKGSYSVIAGDLVQNIHTSINSILHPPS